MHPHTRLRSIAERLGVSVQSASLLFRQMSRAGLVESVDGRYRPTVSGIAYLHESMNHLRDDLEQRLTQLKVVRRSRAVAGAKIHGGSTVQLSMRDGLLTAIPGRAEGSFGRAVEGASKGELVTVDELQGIVPMTPGGVTCFVLPSLPGDNRRAETRLREELRRRRPGLVAADGLEAAHLLRRVSRLPFVRFGVAAAAVDASRLGVEVVVVVTEERLPVFVTAVQERGPSPAVEFQSLSPH
ncbi:MAG: hypothetical protein ACHP93_06335 [Solirubrobacterales bacterium]